MALPIALPNNESQTTLINPNNLGGTTLGDCTVGGTLPWTFPNGIVGFAPDSTAVASITSFGTNPGNGNVTNDSAAFAAAFAWLNAAPGRALYIPPAATGTYYYNQTANGSLSMTQPYSVLYGVGRASSITFTGTTGDGIIETTDYQTLRDLLLTSSTMGAGYYAARCSNGTYCKMRALQVVQSGNGSGIAVSHSSAALGFAFYDINVILSGLAAIAIDTSLTVCSNIIATHIQLQGAGFSGSYTNIGWKFASNVSQDTIVLSNFTINSFRTGMQFSPVTGGVCGDYFFSAGLVDQCYYGGYQAATGTGILNRFVWNQVWFGTGGDAGCAGFYFNNAIGATVYGHSFNQCRFYALNGGAAVSFAPSSAIVQAAQFNGCVFEISSYGAIISSDSECDFVGCTFQTNSSAGILFGLAPGSYSAANFKSVTSCSFKGNGSNVQFANAYSTYAGLVAIRNCPGVNPFGALAGQPAITATGVAQANPYPYDCTVYVTGTTAAGSVTMTGTNGQSMSVPIAVGATVAIAVPVGASITPTYTASTSWIWVAN